MRLYDYVQSADRFLAVPLLGYPGNRLTGVKSIDCFKKPEKQLQVLEFNLKEFKLDMILPLLDLTLEAETLGSEVEYKEYDAPTIKKHVSVVNHVLVSAHVML